MRAVIGMYFMALEGLKEASWITKLTNYFTSNQASETYGWLGNAPVMREFIGAKQAKELRETGLIITNKDFESTVAIKEKDHRRDKTGQIAIRIAELANQGILHWEDLLSVLIANGTGSTNGLCYDGQYFFDSDHSDGDSGVYSNLLTNSSVPELDITSATSPTSSEAIDAILGVIAHMMTYKNDQGQPINNNAKEFLVMTAPKLAMRLAPAILSEQVDSGKTNVLKQLAKEGFSVSIVPNARLAYTTQFVTFRTDAPLKSLIRQEEVVPTPKVLGEGSDHAFKNSEYLYSIETSRNVAYGMPQYAAHATLS